MPVLTISYNDFSVEKNVIATKCNFDSIFDIDKTNRQTNIY